MEFWTGKPAVWRTYIVCEECQKGAGEGGGLVIVDSVVSTKGGDRKKQSQGRYSLHTPQRPGRCCGANSRSRQLTVNPNEPGV